MFNAYFKGDSNRVRATILIVCLLLLGRGLFARAQAAHDMEQLYALANGYFAEGKYKEAEQEYNKIIQLDPAYAPAYNNLGVINSADDTRIKETIVYFLTAARIDPEYAEPFGNLGILCFRIRELDKSISYLERAIQLAPDNFKYQFSLGWVYLVGLNDYSKALGYLQQAADLNDTYAEAYYAMGMAYIGLRDKMGIMEQITNLRMLHREDFASNLENLIRTPSKDNAQELHGSSKNEYVQAGYEIGSTNDSKANVSLGPTQPVTVNASGTITLRLQLIKEDAGKTTSPDTLNQ